MTSSASESVGTTAQVSVYPLRQDDLSPAINAAIEVFRVAGLGYRVGTMSTIVWGETDKLFRALKDAFDATAALGEVVMIITLSNACPLPMTP
ncbi:MAG: thiamine-binding protein [Bacteroidota bacterium]